MWKCLLVIKGRKTLCFGFVDDPHQEAFSKSPEVCAIPQEGKCRVQRTVVTLCAVREGLWALRDRHPCGARLPSFQHRGATSRHQSHVNFGPDGLWGSPESLFTTDQEITVDISAQSFRCTFYLRSCILDVLRILLLMWFCLWTDCAWVLAFSLGWVLIGF